LSFLILYAFSIFILASLLDIKTRMVPDPVWLALLIPAILAHPFSYYTTLPFLLQFLVVTLSGIIGSFFGLWGGADWRALSISCFVFKFPIPLFVLPLSLSLLIVYTVLKKRRKIEVPMIPFITISLFILFVAF